MTVRIKTFGFYKVDPPADATLVIDCRHLGDGFTVNEKFLALVERALDHADENEDAVIAFGCGYGEERSVGVANYTARMLGVDAEHTTRGRMLPIKGSPEAVMAAFMERWG